MADLQQMSKSESFQVFIATEIRLHRDEGGRLRAAHSAAGYDYWRQYVRAYGSVQILGRVDTERISDSGPLVEGPGVTVVGLPDYHGFWGLLCTIGRVFGRLREVGDETSLFVVRLPEAISLATYWRARRCRGFLLARVVSNGGQLMRAMFAPPLGHLSGCVADLAMKWCVKHSTAVVYVTTQWLQTRYPARPGTPTFVRSDFATGSGAFVSRARSSPVADARPLRLIAVGTLEKTYKGFDFLVEVTNRLVMNGFNVTLDVVGGGRHLDDLTGQVRRLGMGSRVRLHGQIHERSALVALLDSADLFMSGSRVEGLPRATLEAMARALPVVSTRAGAVCEILDPACIVPIDDAESFSRAATHLLSVPDAYARASASNLATARRIAELSNDDLFVEFLGSIWQRQPIEDSR